MWGWIAGGLPGNFPWEVSSLEPVVLISNVLNADAGKVLRHQNVKLLNLSGLEVSQWSLTNT